MMKPFSQKYFRGLLVLHLVFFLGWGGWLIHQQDQGEIIWLETVPVDPRDLLSGHYVALRFAIENPTADTCKPLLAKDRYDVFKKDIWVSFAPGKSFVFETNASGNFSDIQTCQLESPSDLASGQWIKTKIDQAFWGELRRLDFEINRFYVSENSPLRQATSGRVVAKVLLGRNHRLRILDLVNLKP